MTVTNVQQSELKNKNEVQVEKLLWVGPLAVAAATLANVLVYYVATRLLQVTLAFPTQSPPPELSQMAVTDVVLFSLIFSVGAVIVFAVVAQFSARPIKPYLIICFVVLILSLFMPLKIPTPPVTMSAKLTLVMMHIIGAIAVVGVLVALCRAKAQIIDGSGK